FGEGLDNLLGGQVGCERELSEPDQGEQCHVVALVGQPFGLRIGGHQLGRELLSAEMVQFGGHDGQPPSARFSPLSLSLAIQPCSWAYSSRAFQAASTFGSHDSISASYCVC